MLASVLVMSERNRDISEMFTGAVFPSDVLGTFEDWGSAYGELTRFLSHRSYPHTLRVERRVDGKKSYLGVSGVIDGYFPEGRYPTFAVFAVSGVSEEIEPSFHFGIRQHGFFDKNCIEGELRFAKRDGFSDRPYLSITKVNDFNISGSSEIVRMLDSLARLSLEPARPPVYRL